MSLSQVGVGLPNSGSEAGNRSKAKLYCTNLPNLWITSPFSEVGAHFRSSDFSIPVLLAANFVPASLNGGVTSFKFAEAGVQWMLYDFDRTGGHYGQAVSQTSIEKLALQRAR